MFFIYSFLFGLSLIISSPYFVFKMFKEKKYYQGIFQRCGFFPKKDKINSRSIWIHAVSVGETLTAIPIIAKLKREYPSYPVILTTTTNTGYNIAKKQLNNKALILFSPLDLGFIIQKFVQYINPKIFIIMETELWPNLIHTVYKNKIPIVILNGRISDKSYQRYRKVKKFYKKIFLMVSHICSQTKQDYDRLLNIGAKADQVCISGNIKFDIEPSAIIDKQKILSCFKIPLKNKIWIAGSTHDQEEEIILKIFRRILSKTADITLILAPRHIERISKIENLIKQMQLSYGTRTQSLKNNFTEPKQVILIDTIGELFSLYNIADIVFVGGSLIPHGGHNILEPAYFQKAIVFGKHMENFREISQMFLKNKAAEQVDEETLQEKILILLSNESLRKELGRNAYKILCQNKGAIEKSMNVIREILKC